MIALCYIEGWQQALTLKISVLQNVMQGLEFEQILWAQEMEMIWSFESVGQ
jgi:hypothetical protein